jgi:Tol biopolymer transport system component
LLVSATTGAVRPLLPPDADPAGHLDPRFSPDGRTLAFLRSLHRSRQDLMTVSLAGGAGRRITDLGSQISGHDWTAEGRAIVLASHRGGEFRLWRMPLANPSDPIPLSVYGEFPIQLAVARNSDRLVYSLLHQDRNIWRLRLPSKSWERIIASTAQDASPQYSPDGQWICFRSDRSGDEQLWVARPDGSDAVQITRGAQRPSVGRWSPTSDAVVFNNPINQAISIARRRSDGSWTVDALRARGVHPVFSHDRTSVYAAGQDAILRIPAEGGTPAVLVKTPAESLSLSPDGKFLYFVREASATSLWRVAVDTGELSRVLDGLVPACTSCWAPAPSGIYYLGIDQGAFDDQALFFHDLRSGQRRLLLRYPEPLWPRGSGPFSLSPDGRDLLTVRVEPSNIDIMLVTPFQ